MKRFLTVFLSFMLIFSSVFVSSNKIYAEEETETLNDEETLEVLNETSDDEGTPEEEEPEIVLEEDPVLQESPAVSDEPEALPLVDEFLGEGEEELLPVPEGLMVDEISEGIRFSFGNNPTEEQKEYLRVLTTAFKYNSNGSVYSEGSHVLISSGDETYDAKNEDHYRDSSATSLSWNKKEIYLSTDRTYVYISNYYFFSDYLPYGEEATFELYALGYEPTELTIDYFCSVESPVSVFEDKSRNIKISYDQDWIESLLYEENSYIKIFKEWDQDQGAYLYSYTVDKDDLYCIDGIVHISRNWLNRRGLLDGDVMIEMAADGYPVCFNIVYLHWLMDLEYYGVYPENTSEGITITIDPGTSENFSVFMNSLGKTRDSYSSSDGGEYVTYDREEYGEIDITDTETEQTYRLINRNWIETDGQSREGTVFTIEGNSIYISREVLFNKGIRNTGDAVIRVVAPGFRDLEIWGFEITSGVSTEIPEVGFYEDTETGDVVIWSYDEEYLNGLCKAAEYDDNGLLVSIGGMISFIDPDGLVIPISNSEDTTNYSVVENDGRYEIVIPGALLENRLENSTYQIKLSSYGYVDHVFDEQLNYLLHVSVTVSQDSDTLDLWVTSENQDWLEEIENLKNRYEGSIDFGDGEHIGLWYDTYFTFVRDDEGLQGFTIAYEALLDRNISSGDHTIIFPSTEHFENVEYELKNLQACIERPEGLKVEETAEGIKFYFENTGDEELAFLENMLVPYTWNNNSGNTISEGSSIEIDSVHSGEWLHNRKSLKPDGTLAWTEDCIIWSESHDYILLTRDAILSETNLINSDDDYTIRLHVYGYANGDSLTLSGLQYANQPLPEDFRIYASLDDDMNITIRTNYPQSDWFEAACRERIYTDYGKNLVKGSSISLYSNDADRDIYLFNQEYNNHPDSKQEFYQLREDEEGKYIYISREMLAARCSESSFNEIKNLKFYFIFNTYGYQDYTSDENTEGEYVIFPENAIKAAPALVIYETDDGEIVISGEDLEDENYIEYMQNLYYVDDNYISISNYDAGTGTGFNSISKYYSPEHIRLNELNEIVFSHDAVIQFGITNGVNEFNILVSGYGRFQTSVTLNHACRELPSEIQVEIDSDKNLVIRCADQNWLNALGANNSWVEFYEISEYDEYNWRKAVSGNRIQIGEEEAVVLKEDLVGLSDGYYAIHIDSYGYGSCERRMNLSGYTKQLTAEVKVTCSSGNLIITCNDKEFMQALAKDDEWYHGESFVHVEGGSIEVKYEEDDFNAGFSNTKEYYNGEETYSYSSYSLDSGKTKITIKKQFLINMHVFNSDSAFVVLHAPGYADVVRTVSLSSLCNPNVPDNVMITSLPNGDLQITASDVNWLKALLEKNGNEKWGTDVELLDDYYNGYSIGNHDSVTYLTFSNNAVIISSDALIWNRVGNGEYSRVILYPYGYRRVDLSLDPPLTITGGLKQAPEGIALRLTESGDLIVYSTVEGNEEFLQNLTKYWVYNKTTGNIDQRGSSIIISDNNYWWWLENYDDKKSGGSEEMVVYDAENNEAVVSRRYLGGISGDGFHVGIQCYGYQDINFDSYSFPFITVASANVLAGGKAQFFVNTDRNVTWSVDDESLATVDEDGWLTAKEPGEVHLFAQIEGNGFIDTIPVTISVPSNVTITVSPTKADAVIGDTVQIVPTVKNGGDYYTVSYVSSDEQIATVSETGLVSFLDSGTVTITSSVYGKSANSVFTVYEYPKADKLTATINSPLYDSANGMEALDQVPLTVSAAGAVIDPSSLEYTSANETVAAIDVNGMITALKSGTVKITAKLKDDPAKRSVTYSLKVYPRVLHALSLSVDEADEISQGYEEGILNLYFNAKTDLNKKFQLYSSGEDKLGNTVVPESLTYAPVDSSVASVDKNGVVTIKKAGQTAIKATVSSNPKGSDPVTCTVIVRVVDYAPRLESNKAVVNKYYTLGTDVNIYAIKGSQIESVKLLNSKLLSENESDLDFFVTYVAGEDHFNITQSYKTRAEAKGKSYSQILRVTLSDGSSYDYAYTVTTSLALPKATVKTSGTYNTALDDSTLRLEITTDEEYDLVLFGDKGIEWAYIDSETGYVKLLDNASGKKITKGTVQIHFKNYNGANYKTNISFKTVSTLPAASLSGQDDGWFEKNTLILNENFSKTYTMNLATDNEKYPVSRVEIKDAEKYDGLSIVYADNKLTVSRDTDIVLKNGTYKYTITPYIDVNGTEKALKNITLSVKVSDALPKVSLSSSSIKLNRNYNETVYVDVKTSEIPAGAGILGFRVNGEEAVSIHYTIINRNLTIRLTNDLPKGTYKYELTPVFNNPVGNEGIQGTPIKFTVNVIDTAAKATVSVKGNLNQLDPESETNCVGTVKLSNIAAKVADAAIDSEYVNVSVNDAGQLVFTLKNRNLTDQTLKNQKLTLTLDTGDVLETNVSIKVARKAPTVKLSQTTLNVYNTSVRNEEVGRIALSEIPFGEMKAIWFSESLAYDLTYDETTNEIVVVLKDAANVKVGSSSAITIKIDWEGDYGTYAQSLNDKTIKGLKTTTLKLTIKDASGTVKAK